MTTQKPNATFASSSRCRCRCAAGLVAPMTPSFRQQPSQQRIPNMAQAIVPAAAEATAQAEKAAAASSCSLERTWKTCYALGSFFCPSGVVVGESGGQDHPPLDSSTPARRANAPAMQGDSGTLPSAMPGLKLRGQTCRGVPILFLWAEPPAAERTSERANEQQRESYFPNSSGARPKERLQRWWLSRC